MSIRCVCLQGSSSAIVTERISGNDKKVFTDLKQVQKAKMQRQCEKKFTERRCIE